MRKQPYHNNIRNAKREEFRFWICELIAGISIVLIPIMFYLIALLADWSQ